MLGICKLADWSGRRRPTWIMLCTVSPKQAGPDEASLKLQNGPACSTHLKASAADLPNTRTWKAPTCGDAKLFREGEMSKDMSHNGMIKSCILYKLMKFQPKLVALTNNPPRQLHLLCSPQGVHSRSIGLFLALLCPAEQGQDDCIITRCHTMQRLFPIFSGRLVIHIIWRKVMGNEACLLPLPFTGWCMLAAALQTFQYAFVAKKSCKIILSSWLSSWLSSYLKETVRLLTKLVGAAQIERTKVWSKRLVHLQYERSKKNFGCSGRIELADLNGPKSRAPYIFLVDAEAYKLRCLLDFR